ncbi:MULTISPECIES: hypothetical protein [unclassified Streptomyces]|uniref:hypothetical protein n=1 Tax=unclassified Streptomyces TaxID=2593676 RepID=UPI0029A49FF8|nr:hypothetical protein [Streptomyces sp. DK15]MDX2396242.1 hypothetical protein [Streptomyces sp. DK15]
MTPGTGTVPDFWARKLPADAGVDPDDLRLHEYEHVDRGVAVALSGFDSERSELVQGAVAIASGVWLVRERPKGAFSAFTRSRLIRCRMAKCRRSRWCSGS